MIFSYNSVITFRRRYSDPKNSKIWLTNSALQTAPAHKINAERMELLYGRPQGSVSLNRNISTVHKYAKAVHYMAKQTENVIYINCYAHIIVIIIINVLPSLELKM